MTALVDGAVDETGSNIYWIDQNMDVCVTCCQKPLSPDARYRCDYWKSENCVTPSDNNYSRPESIHCHGGQLYVHERSNVLVFSGSNWTLTSKVQARGGPICNISIGGDCLITLHNDPDLANTYGRLLALDIYLEVR
ncbi:hypothetical protein CDL15_Pgr002476 [Punica granatum]|uniref:At2g24240-like C-terminal beta-propeller domain-containing protein n=1 Tax=Punica granatum TaxID=22663 RepID=A0A218XVT3_PUNGR|nr:hypothetical protein CDL15_Pgr002476 [Punica granatum]PKI65674.1 hypothetical protein CRG98_013969 [Punica granatum]